MSQPHPSLDPNDIVERVLERYPGTAEVLSWGERSVFYNPGGALPRGVYFLTIKDHDGPNDRAGRLDRDGVYRLSVGVGKEGYERLFGPPPERAPKGEVLNALPTASPAAARVATLMAEEAFAPNFPVHLVAKDLGYAADLAERAGVDAPVVGAAHGTFREADRRGFGEDDIAGVIRVYGTA